jgi:ribosomal-protein-serine acetyltransferase
MAKINLELNHEIVLKQLSLEDAKEINAVLKTKENFFRNWIGKDVVIKTIDDTKVFLMHELTRLATQSECLFSFSDKAGFVGIVGLYSTDKANNKTEMVIWLSKRGKTVQNYIDLVEGLLKFGFMDMNFNRIQVKALANDFALTGALKKFGFINEGTERAGLLVDEKTYTDLAIYGIIKNEYILHTKFMVRASKMFVRKNKRAKLGLA